MKRPNSAVVIGAGLSGLSAAYRLQEAGWRVEVLEASDKCGGRVRTIRRDGFIIDVGPDALSSGYTEYLRLAIDVGLGNSIVACSPIIGLIRNGSIHEIDGSKPIRAALSLPLSISAKLQLALGIVKLRRKLAGTDSFELAEMATDDDVEDAHDYAQRNFGRDAAKHLIDPFVRLVAGTGPRNISHLAVLSALSTWSNPLVNMRGGLDVLPSTAAEELNVRYEARVVALVELANGVVVTCDDDNGPRRFDAAIVATMFDDACAIAPSIQSSVGELAASYEPLNLVSVSLAYGCPTRSKAYVIAVPFAEHPDILLAFLQHNKSLDRAPPGHSLVSFYIEHGSAIEFASHDDDFIINFGRREFERLFPELAGNFLFGSVTRWDKAGWVARPGHYRNVRELQRRMQEASRIILAGDAFSAGSMETAVRWGRLAAKRLISCGSLPDEHDPIQVPEVGQG